MHWVPCVGLERREAVVLAGAEHAPPSGSERSPRQSGRALDSSGLLLSRRRVCASGCALASPDASAIRAPGGASESERVGEPIHALCEFFGTSEIDSGARGEGFP